jgi:hypothetical protein
MLVRLPERGDHPAARDADKADGKHIAEEMIVGRETLKKRSWERERGRLMRMKG